jgi:hypothetical protein
LLWIAKNCNEEFGGIHNTLAILGFPLGVASLGTGKMQRDGGAELSDAPNVLIVTPSSQFENGRLPGFFPFKCDILRLLPADSF